MVNDKGYLIKWEKDELFNKRCYNKWVPFGKIFRPTPHTKINQMDKRFKGKKRNIKGTSRNHRIIFHTLL